MDEQLKIENLPLNKLKVYENNTRKHTDRDIEAITESIRIFGFNDPIGIWSDKNIIVEGHGRYYAAKRLKMETVPVIRLDHLSETQRRAYAIAHNKTAELSVWDRDILDDELSRISGVDISSVGFDMRMSDNLRENLITEISPEEFTNEKFRCKCPECGFRFNP